ncbi:hypothetical protein DSLASN_27750 [Desulfoluna limicola]|uniref:Type 4 fimbrial biogenesis protein PilX N-terminal domain-containing protein n=1 Tax=Desulfoluna limicola TaxID=2810562 RepID=A0ABM7PJ95_9BACT|nr:hypothetical protein [Desulfoluna limicola]BCS97143.1 hypothetical protein DSLASN_27750 [Desulfoluna limicola]
MTHTSNALTNEEGSILLLALVLLILLTIAGLGILSTTDTDLQVTQNDRCFKQNLTRAESAVMEAAQIIAYYESEDSKLRPTEANALLWIEASGFEPFEDNNWRYEASAGGDPQTAQHSKQFTDRLSGYTAIYEGIAPGASIDLSNPTTMRQYEVVGRAEQCNGLLDVIAGYRIRF